MAYNPNINKEFPIDCTGDAVTGDVVRFTERVFEWSLRNPRYIGDRIITAKVISDSYGRKGHQHTFSIEILNCEGVQPLAVGTKTTRKGRNIYRHGTARKLWEDETQREIALRAKHALGGWHRTQRAMGF